MTIKIKYSKQSSKTALLLKNELKKTIAKTARLRINTSTWVGTHNDLLINWGSSKAINEGVNAVVLNKPKAVAIAVDKVRTYSRLITANIPTVSHLTKGEDTAEFLREFLEALDYNPGKYMFRSTTTGYGGEGITVVNSTADEFLDDYNNIPEFKEMVDSTKVVTRYFKASQEYRVHVMMGKPIYVQQKKLRTDDERPEVPNFDIRNHSNGFVFCTEGVEVPPLVTKACIDAVKALGLDFGAVDVRYNPVTSECCVLEVNSAPSLTGTTLEVYVETFKTIHSAVSGIAKEVQQNTTLYGVTLEEGTRYSVDITSNNAEAVSTYLSSKGFMWNRGETLEEFPVPCYAGTNQLTFDHNMCRGKHGTCHESTNIEVDSRFHGDTPTQEPTQHGDVPGPTPYSLWSTMNEVSLRSQADDGVVALSTIDGIISITDGIT